MRVRRAVLLVGIALVGTGLLINGPAGASAAPVGKSALIEDPKTSEDALINALLDRQPGFTRDEAIARVEGQSARTGLDTQVVEVLGDYGTSSYDLATNTMHFRVKDPASIAVIQDLAAKAGVQVTVSTGAATPSELQAIADGINVSRTDEQTASNSVFASIDYETGKVAVSITDPAARELLTKQYGQDPQIELKYFETPLYQTACTSRTSCGTPARAGLVIGIDTDGAGPGASSPECSEGFTAATPDGGRWILTAGHCSQGISTACGVAPLYACWGAGSQYFGPMRQAHESGNVSVAWIRKDNSYWASGGWMYNVSSLNSPLHVTGRIDARSAIHVGDGLCSNAWHSVLSSCGYVTDVSSIDGLVQIDYTVCDGDSGGGWFLPYYSPTVGNTNIAYGLQVAIDRDPALGCANAHLPSNFSYMSALPDINAFDDTQTGASNKMRVQTQSP